MMELMKGLPDNVIGIIGSGTITGEDYDTVIIPAMKDKKAQEDSHALSIEQGLCTLCTRCLLRRCKGVVAHTFI